MASTWEEGLVVLISQQNLSDLRHKMNRYQKIVITGSSGWLGSETAELLIDSIGLDILNRLTLITSIPRVVHLRGVIIKTFGWEDFKRLTNVDLLIHFAFLNQEKAQEIGFPRYIESNRRITSDVNWVLHANPGCDLIVASSGAVEHFSPDISSANSFEVYSALKQESEKSILSNSSLGALLIVRIWNVTGSRLRIEAPYAVSNLFKQGIEEGRIILSGNSMSTRTYVDVKEMMLIFLLCLSESTDHIMNSGGFTTKIGELATKIGRQLNLSHGSIKFNGENCKIEAYVPKVEPFNAFARVFGVKLSDIDTQIHLLHQSFQNHRLSESREIT